MGRYVNPGNRDFAGAVHSGIYVDKTGMLEHNIRELPRSSSSVWSV